MTTLNSLPAEAAKWERRRYETARDLLCAYRANPDENMCKGPNSEKIRWAVEEADALLAELRMCDKHHDINNEKQTEK